MCTATEQLSVTCVIKIWLRYKDSFIRWLTKGSLTLRHNVRNIDDHNKVQCNRFNADDYVDVVKVVKLFGNIGNANVIDWNKGIKPFAGYNVALLI